MNNFLSMDKRLENFKAKLTQDQYNIYVYGMAKEVQPIVEEKLKIIDSILASSTMAALTDIYDLSLEECKEVIDRASQYMQEDSKIANKYKEDYSDMIDKKEQKIREAIRQEIKHKKAGEEKFDICKRIANRFDVCVSDVVLMYTDEKLNYKRKYKEGNEEEMANSEKMRQKAELKEKIKERCEFYIKKGKSQIYTVAEVAKELNTTRTDVAVIYKAIRKEQKAELEKEDMQKSENKAHTEDEKESKEVIQENTEKSTQAESDSKKDVIKENPFKVIEETVKLEGKYGTYVKSADGVQAGQVHFSKKEDVDNYEQAELEKVDKEVESEIVKIQDQIDKLEVEKSQIYKKAETEKSVFKDQTEEIRQVFDYGKAM